MMRTETIAGVVKSLVEIIVRVPKCVRVTSKTSTDMAGREVTSFEIDVHHSDRGRLIGRGGANIRALRILLNSAGYVWGVRYRVSCNNGARDDHSRETAVGIPEFVHNLDARR